MEFETKKQQIPLFWPPISYSDKNPDTYINVYKHDGQDSFAKIAYKVPNLIPTNLQSSLFGGLYDYFQ